MGTVRIRFGGDRQAGSISQKKAFTDEAAGGTFLNMNLHGEVRIMKKILSFLAFTALLGGLAHAQVTSVNAVGMVKIEANRGEFIQLAIPFTDENDAFTVQELFGDTLPSGTNIYVWADNSYTTISRGRSGWSEPDYELNRGQGFYLSIPPTASDETYPIVLTGDVPGERNASTTDITILPGFTFVGNPYPVTTKLSESGLAPMSQSGDVIYIWNGGSWDSIIRGRNGWSSDPDLKPGQGFYYSSASLSNRTWTETKLYNWP